MNESNNYQKVQELYDNLTKSIEENDFKKIRQVLKSIDIVKDSFLKDYKDRKKEGVYYTSKEISNFMTNETLLLLLNKRLKKQYDINQEISYIEDFSRLYLKTKEKISNILLNASILDPACGSGVFILSVADKIYNLVSNIKPNCRPMTIKTQILKNIVGFDINEHALMLSKLKLFNWCFEEKTIDYSEVISILNLNLKQENSIINPYYKDFDVVIGNPPYGNILSKADKEILKEQGTFYNDIYCAFLIRALNWGKGVISFLVPKSFLLRQGYIKFRELFLSKANLLKIYNLGPNLFKTATNEVQIVIYEKKGTKNNNLMIYDYPDKKIISYNNQNVDNLRICFNKDCPLCNNSKKMHVYTFKSKCPYCQKKTLKINRIRIKPDIIKFQIINKIERIANLNYLNPIDFPKMIRGEEDQGLKNVKKLLKNDVKESCLFLNAKTDFKYYYLKRSKSLNIELINPNILKGDNYEYYRGPRLLIKHNNIIPEAIYTEEFACFTSSIYSLLSDDVKELKYLCGILNSILIQFYCTYGINNQKNTTINLNQYMIRHLPVIKADEHIKAGIATIVEEIITQFENNKGVSNERIFKLIKEIDAKIFSLYSITNEERQIIISDVKRNLNFFRDVYKS